MPEQLTLAAHWVDHIVAEKHGGQTEEANLALSCVLCNQHKGSDPTSSDPETGEITRPLPPPGAQWTANFRSAALRTEPLTRTGGVPVGLLQLIRPARFE